MAGAVTGAGVMSRTERRRNTCRRRITALEATVNRRTVNEWGDSFPPRNPPCTVPSAYPNLDLDDHAMRLRYRCFFIIALCIAAMPSLTKSVTSEACCCSAVTVSWSVEV